MFDFYSDSRKRSPVDVVQFARQRGTTACVSSSLDTNCSGKMEPLQRAALTLSLVLLCSVCAHGAVRMPKFFSNGLVLQTNSQSGVRQS